MAARRDRGARQTGPGILGGALAILAGALWVQALPTLPSRWIAGLVAAAGLAALAVVLRRRLPAWACWGALLLAASGWTAWRADLALAARLPHALEKQDILVTGRVIDLPQAQDGSTRFDFRVAHAEFRGRAVPVHGHVRLSWYATRTHAPPAIEACTTWRLRVRMKRPRGLINPGGLDFERTALQRGIVATGYVREDPGNRLLRTGGCVDGIRTRIAGGIEAALPRHLHATRLLRALAVGDERALDEHDWQVVRATGIPHLIAIAGLQIGIAAVLGAWLVRALWWCIPALGTRWPRPLAEAMAALPAAAGYAALAGFGVPATRSLLMIAAVVGWRLLRRGGRLRDSLGLALASMLIIDPLAVLSAGFWLSFVGVAMLAVTLAYETGWRGRLREIGVSPLLMAIALLPLTVWFFGQASLTAPLTNIVAAPIVTLVVVPMDLLACVLLLAWPGAGTAWLHACAWPVDVLWWFLAHVAAWKPSLQYLPETSLLAFVLASVGALWLVAPRGVPARALGAFLLLPMGWPRVALPEEGAFRATVIDVGQGLSVLVRTRTHALLFDTGARYPSGFDLGEAVVVPAMHALGARRLDALVISHGDNDHAGGAVAVLAAWPTSPVWGGQPARGPVPMQQCHAGQRWTWDGVEFRVVGPALPLPEHVADNDLGCVVLVSGRGGRLLLPADTSTKVEPAIAAAVPPGPPLVLVAPHHGSKTSSSRAYLEALRPRFAVASTGYLNAYHHPSPGVVQRYASLGIPLLATPDTGAVRIAFPARGGPRVTAEERLRQARYWREPGAGRSIPSR